MPTKIDQAENCWARSRLFYHLKSSINDRKLCLHRGIVRIGPHGSNSALYRPGKEKALELATMKTRGIINTQFIEWSVPATCSRGVYSLSGEFGASGLMAGHNGQMQN